MASASEGLAGDFTPEGRTGLPESAYAEGMHVVVVDDEPRMVELVCRYLDDQQVSTDGRFDGPTGLEAARQPGVDAVVLDLMLPGLSGVDVCTRLRAEGNDVPVLMLTARGAVAERVAGLEAGADDYLVKPFALEELHARLRAIRRRRELDDGQRVVVGDVVLDRLKQRVWVDGAEVRLSRRELAMLTSLMENRGHVVSRSRLFDDVWADEVDISSNAIDVHMSRLRSRLESSRQVTITTLRGVGYRLEKNKNPAR
ncbi:MAG: two-component system, OmpR family, response regulator [Nocardioidaceae bacterium]|nr:two-component system, OmpR family, response regulator [Nocardioidaceae bacterium]